MKIYSIVNIKNSTPWRGYSSHKN